MTFFVDANIIVYAATSSPQGSACKEIVLAVAGGSDGRTSTAALEEVWYLELSGRIPGLDGICRRSYDVFSPLLAVTDDAFRLALGLGPRPKGANGRLHVGTCLANGIDVIVSADVGFDEIAGIRRVDPLDDKGVRRLLAQRT